LGLGEHLVRELGHEKSTNTLGRWMAHQLAADMLLAEKAGTAKERATAKKDAKDTILKIWSLRDSLPGEAFPLARYRKLLVMLEAMRPNNNPYAFFSGISRKPRNELAGKIFDMASRLVYLVLILEGGDLLKKKPATSKAAFDALALEEKKVLLAIERCSDLFLINEAEAKRRTEGTKSSYEESELLDFGLQFIAKTKKSLLDLEKEFKIKRPKIRTEER
jgi:hypothetical protein